MSALPLIAAAMATLGALGVAVLLIIGKRVPPVAGVAPVALVPLSLWIALRRGFSQASATADLADPEAWSSVHGALLGQTLQWAIVPALAMLLPAMILLIGCAIAGVRRGPRQIVPFAVGLPLVFVLTATPQLAFLSSADANPATMVLTPVLFALGLLTVVAFFAGDSEGSGPEASAIAGLTLALATPTLGVALIASDLTTVFAAVSAASVEMKSTLEAAGYAISLPVITAVWAASTVATTIALLGLSGMAGLSTPRKAAALAGTAWLVLVPLLLLAVDPLPSKLATETGRWAELLPAPTDDFQLAVSTAQRPVGPRHHLDITRRELRVDGTTFLSFERVVDDLGRDAVTLGPEDRPRLRGELAAAFRPAQTPAEHDWTVASDSVLIKCDRRIPWALAREILAATAAAGRTEFLLAVRGEWSGPAVITAHSAPPLATPEPGAPLHPELPDATVIGVPETTYGDSMYATPTVIVTSEGLTLSTTALLRITGGGEAVEPDKVHVPCLVAGCPSTGDYDLRALTAMLGRFKDAFPDEESIRLTADDAISWEVIAAVLDAAREDEEAELDGRPRLLFPYPQLVLGE